MKVNSRRVSQVSRSSKTSRLSEKRQMKRTQKQLEKIDRLALPPTKIPKVVLDNEASFDSVDSAEKKGKRGRKMMESDKYIQESEKKINEWKDLLKTGVWPNGKPVTENDVAKLKNQISAQRSRANKKMEVKALQEQILAIHKQVKLVLKTVSEVMPDQRQKIVDNIYSDSSNKPSQEELSINYEGNGKNASASSKSKKANNDKFSSIVGKFIGF